MHIQLPGWKRRCGCGCSCLAVQTGFVGAAAVAAAVLSIKLKHWAQTNANWMVKWNWSNRRPVLCHLYAEERHETEFIKTFEDIRFKQKWNTMGRKSCQIFSVIFGYINWYGAATRDDVVSDRNIKAGTASSKASFYLKRLETGMITRVLISDGASRSDVYRLRMFEIPVRELTSSSQARPRLSSPTTSVTRHT